MGINLWCRLDLSEDDRTVLAGMAIQHPRNDLGTFEARDRVVEAYRDTGRLRFPDRHFLTYSEPADYDESDVDENDEFASDTHDLLSCIRVNCLRDFECSHDDLRRAEAQAGEQIPSWFQGPHSVVWCVDDVADAIEAADILETFFPGEFDDIVEWLRDTASTGATMYWPC